MELFYIDRQPSEFFTLSEEESKHISRVLRFGKGDFIFLTTGKGDLYKAEITDDHPKACVVKIIETRHQVGKKNYSLHIAIAPTKNSDRFEWFLEKATEIGVDEITPLICEHSERRVIKDERLNKVLLAAMKQSGRCYLPKLNEAAPFSKFISQPFSNRKFICSTDTDKNRLLKNLYLTEKDALILIGPEGDFSKNELDLAVKNKFEMASLGESRLRTETAGIVACHTISLLNQ